MSYERDKLAVQDEIHVVEQAIELWEWLAQHPGERKLQFKGSYSVEEMISQCPFCQYCKDLDIMYYGEDNLGCESCIMKGRWPASISNQDNIKSCQAGSDKYMTAYDVWEKTGSVSSAAILVKAFKERLDELTIEEKTL